MANKTQITAWTARNGEVRVYLARDSGPDADQTPYLLMEATYRPPTPNGIVALPRGNLDLLSTAIATAKKSSAATLATSSRQELATWTAKGRTIRVFVTRGADIFAHLVLESMMPGWPMGSLTIERSHFAEVLAAIERVKAT